MRKEIALVTFTPYKGGTHWIVDEFELDDDLIIHVPAKYNFPVIVHLLGKDIPDYIMFDFGEEKIKITIYEIDEQDLFNLLNRTSENLRKIESIEYGREGKINICAIYERFGNRWVKTSVCAKSKLSLSKQVQKNTVAYRYHGTY